MEHRDELIHTIEAELAKHPRQYWLGAFEREQVPCGPVLSTAEILESPVMRVRKAILTMEDPASGPVKVLRSPMRFAGLEPRRLEPAPRLGEHTAKILQELG